MENTVAQIKAYFGAGTREVSAAEMMLFWKSLTEEEKDDLKTADLT